MFRPVLLVHGGAGAIPEETRPAHREGLRQALDAGWHVLAGGGSALDAVVAAVQVMEDLPQFNAGQGSSLTREETVEMDAGLMTGENLGVGAVCAVSRVANPILLARHVLIHSPHILLAGAGAEAFAQAQGIPLIDPATLITEHRRQALARWRAQQAGDTVGAVALDVAGHLAAATSTGGVNGKWPGRVGDSPLVGCGFYADDRLGACSTTGWGESIAPCLLAYRAVAALEGGRAPEEVAREAIAFLDQRTGGWAGLILLDRRGRVGVAWNSPRLSHACRAGDEVNIVA